MDTTRVEDINLRDIPMQALRQRVREKLASMLNQRKLIPSPENFYRDYRGLAVLMELNIDNCWTPNYNNPIASLLEKSRHSIADLQEFLERIDRFDVLDDCHAQFLEDAIAWWEQRNQVSSPLVSPDDEILTIDEVLEYRIMYDAFLLYVDADIKFATEIVKTLESRYHLKICVKDRLAGGVIFEHAAIMELISERCLRLIVLLSDEFVSSDKDTFFLNFAQFLSLEKKTKKRFIVPVKYKPCNLPKHYLVYFMLDHMRNGMITNFWEKLYASVVTVSEGSQKDYSDNAIQSISSPESISSIEKGFISPMRHCSSNPSITPETTSNVSRQRTVRSKLNKFFKRISKKRSKNISPAKQVACVS